MSNLVYYLAGPMAGSEDWGRARFAAAEKGIRRTYTDAVVLNPACLPVGMPEERYMPICLAMVQAADIVAMLPGWENSAGAALERAYALKCGKAVIILDDIHLSETEAEI